VAVQVTWTKLFVFAGTLIAGMYGVTAYVDTIAEGRQASQSRDLAALRKDLDDTLAKLAAGDAEARDKLRKELLDALEQRSTQSEGHLDRVEGGLDQLRTDMLAAIAKGPNPLAVAPSPP
jgi:hypothetical protein